MTWEEWVNSEYNTINAYTEQITTGVFVNGIPIVLMGAAAVNNSDIIYDNTVYILTDKSPRAPRPDD